MPAEPFHYDFIPLLLITLEVILFLRTKILQDQLLCLRMMVLEQRMLPYRLQIPLKAKLWFAMLGYINKIDLTSHMCDKIGK